MINIDMINIEKLKENIQKRELISFEDFINNTEIKHIFHNIFNIIPEMIEEMVGDGNQELKDDPENIGFFNYNMDEIFTKNQDDPFFADRLFANRFVKKFKTLKNIGTKQNRIYVFRGPPGSGKSTFLNCFLKSVTSYVNNSKGKMYETVWKLNNDKFSIPCPSHDNPILLIPKEKRKEIFSELLDKDPELKKKVMNEKEYEWLFVDEPCAFCTSMFQNLSDKGENPYKHIYARQYFYDRKTGEGVSVYNPLDEIPRFKNQAKKTVFEEIEKYFENSDVVYDFSTYAKSSNGIYAVMDLKNKNRDRLLALRGIVSEGKHRVGSTEESIRSLILIVTNPEDEKTDDVSLEDRKDVMEINHVLIPETQKKIFEKIYGTEIMKKFQPGVVENFSKIIISTRMSDYVDHIEEWLKDLSKYTHICDERMMLLKMELYNGKIPEWLTEEDQKNFKASVRRKIINIALTEGISGFSVRDSIELFIEFYNKYKDDGSLIDINKLIKYCLEENERIADVIDEDFIWAVERSNMYQLFQQMKESLFQYNTENIERVVDNYLYSLRFNIGDSIENSSTGDFIEITEDYYKQIEEILFGDANEESRKYYYQKYMKEVVSEGKQLDVKDTNQFKELYDKYIYNLKEDALDIFVESENFRNAVLDYGTDQFNSYDKDIRNNVNNLIDNMKSQFGYTEQGAKEICVYVVDKINS